MKIKEKINAKNLSIILGLIGFVFLFIIFTFPCTAESDNSLYSLYSLFFTINTDLLFPISGLLFFIAFLVNLILYITLLSLTLLDKNTAKVRILGILGNIVNAINLILMFSLIFTYSDISVLVLTLVAMKLVGFFVTYNAWLHSCKKRDDEEKGLYDVNAREYKMYAIIEMLLFASVIAILILVILSIHGGNEHVLNSRSSSQKDSSSQKENTSQKDNIIEVNNKKYRIEDNKIFDIATHEEVGYIENDKVIFKVKK